MLRRGKNCQKFWEKWRRRNQKERHSVRRVQVTYPLLHKRSINKQSPFLLYTCTHFLLSTIFSFLDVSEEEGAVQPLSTEEEGGRSNEELGRGGGFSSPTRGGGQRAIVKGRFVLLSPILPSSLYFSIDTEFSLTILAFYLDFIFFQGLNLLQRASLLWEEAKG